MDNRRLFRSILATGSGIALLIVVMLALSPPVPAAAAPALSPIQQTYTGTLQFDGTLLYDDDKNEAGSDIYIYQEPGPLKIRTMWACPDGDCWYQSFLGWYFATGGPPIQYLKVCVTNQYPVYVWGADDVPPSMKMGTCDHPERTGYCETEMRGFAWYWSLDYGAYCYDLSLYGSRPYLTWVGFRKWIKNSRGVASSTWYMTVVEVDGLVVTQPITDCIEVDSVIMTGPATATVGVATDPYELSWSTSEPAEVEIVVGVDAGGIAQGPLWGETDDQYREFFMRWLVSGTHTVTARIETPCDYGEASVTTEITASAPLTNIIPLLPIGDCDVEDPESACYFYCVTLLPGNYGWDIGGWINWLVGWLICLFQWLARVLLWIGLSIVNTLIGVLNIVLTWDGSITADIIHTIEYWEFTWSNFVEQSFANFGKFLSDHILVARDWAYAALTWLADEFENGFDVFGDNVEAFFTELAEWTQTNLTEFGEMANESITNYGESRGADIDHFRDWSYEGLLELAAYFSGWGNGVGDFLAMLVLAFADWLYTFLTAISAFVVDFFDKLGNMVEAVLLWAGQALYILLVSIGKILNSLITGLGLFIANLIRLFRDNLYVWMTNLAAWVEGFFTGLGIFLGMVIHKIADFAKMLVYAFNAIMTSLSMAAQLLIVLITLAVDAILSLYAAVIWASQLVLSLIDALITGFQSDTVPEMYTGAEGLFYFWQGLGFFETIAESSPLSVINTIAIGLIGFNLLFWTVRQISDIISDVLNFA